MRTGIIGLHARNDVQFTLADFEAIRLIQPRWLKMMSHTSPDVFARILNERSEVQFVTRLYDGSNFGVDHHPPPQEFCERISTHIDALSPYCLNYQIHNEPNHQARYEGWGDTEGDARDFDAWFCNVFNILKSAYPHCQFGFPGLAVPHRDIMWLEICQNSIQKADWLGVHCYWQNISELNENHLNPNWGLRFIQYHAKFPGKPIYILEAGNSNLMNDIPLDPDRMAQELVDWYLEVACYDYVVAACPFLLSSPDQTWDNFGFTWIDRNGKFKPIVEAVARLNDEFEELSPTTR
jgi:hypothetical protein